MFQTTHIYHAITNLSKVLYLEPQIKQHVSYKYGTRERGVIATYSSCYKFQNVTNIST